MLIGSRSDSIRTLRARGTASDPLATRRTLERALDSIELRPRGMPAGAIVCIRRMRTSAPRASVQGAWGAELAAHIEVLLSKVVRPFHDMVPAGAEAVMWLDEAELLACLARDWYRGSTSGWWWRSVLREPLSGKVVERLLLTHPRFVPAAFELLATKDLAVPLVRALQPTFCEQLGATVATTFGAADWTIAEPRVRDSHARRVSGGSVTADTASMEAVGQLLVSIPDFSTLDDSPRALLGLALMLQRAPRLGRSAALLPTLRSARAPMQDLTIHGRPAWRHENTTRPVEPTSDEWSLAAERTASGRQSESDEQGSAFRAHLSRKGPLARKLAAHNDATPPVASSTQALFAAPQAPMQEASGEHAFRPSDTIRVNSAFAGLVYLINIALALELYSDFTQPETVGLPIPFAEMLLQVGERLGGRAFREDPIEAVLLALIGDDERTPIPSEEWLDGVMYRLEVRTAGAVGEQEQSALLFVCSRNGDLVLSRSRLDAHFELATHPLALRLAGIDRDPGWVPALGRMVTFHYS